MRMPAFQRKKPAGVSVVIAAGKPDDETPENGGPSAAESMGEPSVCPKCGTCFDDESGEIYPEGHEKHPMTGADDDDDGPDPTATASQDEG